MKNWRKCECCTYSVNTPSGHIDLSHISDDNQPKAQALVAAAPEMRDALADTVQRIDAFLRKHGRDGDAAAADALIRDIACISREALRDAGEDV